MVSMTQVAMPRHHGNEGAHDGIEMQQAWMLPVHRR
jgi:hypothetical protein